MYYWHAGWWWLLLVVVVVLLLVVIILLIVVAPVQYCCMFINFVFYESISKTHLWFYLPVVLGSSLSWIPSVLVSRKHWNPVLDVVQCHKPSLILKSLANGFVSVLVQDVAALQDAWDLWWSFIKEKLVTVWYQLHYFSPCGNDGQEEEGSEEQEIPGLQGRHHQTLCL